MSNVIPFPNVFNFGNAQVRVVLIDGQPWFVAADICRALQLQNPTKALYALDDDEKSTSTIEGLSRGNDTANIVSESGMYTLVLRCRDAVKPGTVPHRFRKWVTTEVLPTIRKTGAYGGDATPEGPLLISHQQQTALERAVHDLALFAGSKGRNYRSVCLATWRDLREYFGLREYAQLPANRFDEAIEFVAEKRAEWEVVDSPIGYTLENFMDMMHDFYLGGKVPSRVEVEVARKCLIRTRDAIVEAKLQIGGLKVVDPDARKCINNARKLLSRRNLNVPIEYASLRQRRAA